MRMRVGSYVGHACLRSLGQNLAMSSYTLCTPIYNLVQPYSNIADKWCGDEWSGRLSIVNATNFAEYARDLPVDKRRHVSHTAFVQNVRPLNMPQQLILSAGSSTTQTRMPSARCCAVF